MGDNAASLVGDLLWFGPLKWLQRLFFHTPLVNLFVFGSFLYHDYIWYPLRGRRFVNSFHNSKWGRLFDERYGAGGVVGEGNPHHNSGKPAG